jgi:hypothetical protein
MEHSTDDDVWHVQLPSGDVCMMTLELLDDAFQDGLIHERSLVWKEGSPGWMTLAEVAGLDDDAASAPPPSTDASTTPPPYSVGPLSTAPVAADIGDMDFDLEAASFRPRKRSPVRWMAAAALVGAAAFGFVKRGALVGSFHLPANGSFANATGALIATPTLPPPAPAPVVAAPPAAPEVTSESRLSEETKRALEEADKKLAAKQQQKQKELQSRTVDRPRAKVKSENPFRKGGSKFDPLNASL